MMDLRQYTVKEFAEIINEKAEVITELMRNNNHLGYSNRPYDDTVAMVQKAEIKVTNREVVAKFVYTNLFNRPEHRFYR